MMAALVLLATAIASAALTRLLRYVSLRRQLLDVPTGRSSHPRPTPRLGGVAIAVTCAGAWLAAPLGGLPAGAGVPAPFVAGGAIAAAVGLVDDLAGLSPIPKLIGEAGAAAPVLLLLPVVPPGWPVAVTLGAAALWIVAYTNVFNFMDGSDGLAGGIAVLTMLVLGVLALDRGIAALAWTAFAVAAASLGFLRYNWPPASIFMGDAGSLFLGYAFAVLGLLFVRAGVSAGAVGLALTPFLFDGTFTLARRLLRGEPVWRAHRSHLYQRLLILGWSHAAVARTYCAWAACSGVLAVAVDRAGAAGRVLLLAAAAAGMIGAPVLVWRLEHGAERAWSGQA